MLKQKTSPHNGRNLTTEDFGNAVTAALNVAPNFGTTPAKAFIRDSGKTYFDLEDLNQPGILQHIASLTRDDLNAAWDNTKPSADRIAALLADSETEHLSVKSMARTRLRVEALSEPAKMTFKEHALGYIEASLVLAMMNENGVPSILTFPSFGRWAAPKERVSTWLSEERFPEELGWKRSERHITVFDLLPVMSGIFVDYWVQTGTAFWHSTVSPMFGSHEEL